MDELEQRINHCHTKGMEDEEDFERAAKALGAAPGNKAKKSVAGTPAGKFTDCFSCKLLMFLGAMTDVSGHCIEVVNLDKKLYKSGQG